ncbi:MAG: hypothetical protein VYB44_07360 [Bacteroidota bacterium]|nr:hypothetical protein [Bacteroidota bacterium]
MNLSQQITIGNHLKKDGIVVQIDGTSIRDIEHAENVGNKHPYQPIDLNENILSRMGYVEKTGWDDMKIWLNEDKGIDLLVTLQGYEFLHVIIKYQHQLENLEKVFSNDY